MSATAEHPLARHLSQFRLREFRPGQLDVISAVIAGEDCMCIMPTGGGKSLCYQLPAIARPGLTLVVSPLIALMKDQVDTLVELGLRATFINSTLSQPEVEERIQTIRAGGFDLVYVAPERFRSGQFVSAVQQVGVQLLAIDEAHCISEWGHDFRHDYAKLGQFRRKLGNPQTIALTATATPEVRDDVVKQLELRSPRVFVAGFQRPNLEFSARLTRTANEKDQAIEDVVREMPGSGIVYVSARKRCDEVAQAIQSRTGRRAGVYHAGLLPDERRRAQEDFMDGKFDVVVATNAFGMGIDKANVRFVVHYNMPGSLEAYYQEAGRAGRDLQPSRCVLLFSPGDRFIHEFFIESAYPARDVVQKVYNYLRRLDEDPIQLTQQEVKDKLNLSISEQGVGACEQLLEKAGVLERMESWKNMGIVELRSDVPTMVELVPRQAKNQRQVMRAIEQIVGNRRHERVYFQPQELIEATGLEPAAVARALKELTELKSFDYVPPFRGRAIHMRDRETPFDRLEIDFAGMELRKKADYGKLDRLFEYANSKRCRQVDLCRYFGDEHSGPCGNCDRCLRGQRPARLTASAAPQAQAPATTAPAQPQQSQPESVLQLTARKVLSGVARTRGRFGMSTVAQMLKGSQSAQMKKFKLDELSTYGLLKHLRVEDIQQLMESMIHAELLTQEEEVRFRPLVRLTPDGEAVMRGEMPLDDRLNISADLAIRLGVSLPRPVNSPASRPAISPAAGSMRIDAPANVQTSSVESASAASINVAPAIRRSTEPRTLPDYQWSWQLLRDGYTAKECQAIRRISAEVLLNHLIRCLQEGMPAEACWLMTPDEIAAMNVGQSAGDGDSKLRTYYLLCQASASDSSVVE